MRSLLILITLSSGPLVVQDEWKQLSPLPDKEGLAGTFAGVTQGKLLVAGGANFPEGKPWAGGRKHFHDNIQILDKPDGRWRNAGRLQRPLGYGISVTHATGVICAGGSDGQRHYADAFRLESHAEHVINSSLPALPKPVAYACAALVGEVLYVAGGQEKPDANSTVKSVWSLDLGAAYANWKEVEGFPGSGRMLAVAASFDGAFWLMGGVDLVTDKNGKAERHYLKDAYRYEPGKGWTRVADLPHPVAAAPSPCPADATGFTILGGDDGSQVNINPEKHPGFNSTVLHYDGKSGTWSATGKLPAPRVTVPCVNWNSAWVIPSGEVRPGVRSPEVWMYSPGKKP